MLSSTISKERDDRLSEHIVHTAILEDCFNLMTHSDEIPPEFRKIAAKYINFARLGCITISGDKFSFRLLEDCKAKWDTRRPEQMLEPVLSFVFGWVSHRAADRQMKPIWKEPDKPKGSADVDPKLSPTECSIYHEGAVFRKYYTESGNLRYVISSEKFADLDRGGRIKMDKLEGLMQALVLRNLFELQTIEEDDVDAWFEKVDLRTQRFYVDINRYVASALRPEPDKAEEYLTGINFYDDSDRIIAAAKRLRNGDTMDCEELKREIFEEPASHYGKALKLAYQYVKAAGVYFFTDMSIDTLKDHLDIGKPGRDGRPA